MPDPRSCFDGVKRLALIRGKKVLINQADINLIAKRSYQDEKADVILKYSADEARLLKAYGELPESAKINESENMGPAPEDDGADFKFEFIAGDEDEDAKESDDDSGPETDDSEVDDVETGIAKPGDPKGPSLVPGRKGGDVK